VKSVVRIIWGNDECYEASITNSNIRYTEDAFEELVKNCAKLAECALLDRG
jgi:hypothetical protein